jgi:hypothetical protein
MKILDSHLKFNLFSLGCDLHAKQQSIAMVDTETGEFTEKTLSHEGNEVREFYAALEGPVAVGIEVYVQFERRTEASAQARLLRPDTDESFEQRRNMVGGE